MYPRVAEIFIIGTGRVGTGMALALASSGQQLVGLYNRGAANRARSEKLSHQAVAHGELATAPGLTQATVILLCVADSAIAEVAQALTGLRLRAGAVVAHTSGCLDASVLAGIPEVAVGSMHPLCTCPDPERAALAMRRCLYVIEGDSEATASLSAIAAALSGRSQVITGVQKPRYHAAAVLASNLVVALLDTAIAEASAAGLDAAWIGEAMADLAIGACERVRESDPVRALTGPVARGDIGTVAKHLEGLTSDSRQIYTTLSARALSLAQKGGLADQAALALTALIDKDFGG